MLANDEVVLALLDLGLGTPVELLFIYPLPSLEFYDELDALGDLEDRYVTRFIPILEEKVDILN